MKNLLIPIAFLLLFALPACKEKQNNLYESCCGTQPTADAFELNPAVVYQNDTIEKAAVYIPNIFIVDPSNTSSVDNLFIIFGDSRSIMQIVSMVLTDENGNALFSQFSFYPNDPGKSWDGLGSDGSPYYGKFNYQVEVKFINGQSRIYTSSACAVECSSGDFPNQVLPDCFFPNQNNGLGGPDASLPQPKDCF